MKNWVKILLSVLVLLISFAYAYFHLNEASIYFKLGKYYTEKNNYELAQQFYEKSYSLGNKDMHFRESYVNILINSPLTINAQKRLIQIAEDNINDTASASAKSFLFNLKREINNKYKNNYVQQGVYNQKVVHWGRMPIKYTFKNKKDVSAEIINAIDEAFKTWESVGSAYIKFEETQMKADIVINFINDKIKSPKEGEKYVVAYTVPYIVQNRLNRMDMTFNIVNLEGKPYTPNQMYNIALHEVFHALGFLGHSLDKENIMYMTNSTREIINNKKREISDADKVTFELFYKILPDITNDEKLTYDYIPYSVIGNDTEVNYIKAGEARNYIQKAPNIPAGYIDLAQTQLNEKNYDAAIKNLEKALSLSKNSETKYLALYNLAVANYLEGNNEWALSYIKKAKEIKDEEELHALSAEIYVRSRDNNFAIREYELLISKNPNNIEYVISLANIYIKSHKYFAARKVLKNYIKNHPYERNNPRFKPCRILLL